MDQGLILLGHKRHQRREVDGAEICQRGQCNADRHLEPRQQNGLRLLEQDNLERLDAREKPCTPRFGLEPVTAPQRIPGKDNDEAGGDYELDGHLQPLLGLKRSATRPQKVGARPGRTGPGGGSLISGGFGISGASATVAGAVAAPAAANTIGPDPSAAFHFASQAWRCARPTVPPFRRRVTFTTSSAFANGRQPHRTKSATPHSRKRWGSLTRSGWLRTSSPVALASRA